MSVITDRICDDITNENASGDFKIISLELKVVGIVENTSEIVEPFDDGGVLLADAGYDDVMEDEEGCTLSDFKD